METVDYTESEFRYELEGGSRDYDNESFGAHGYQTQEVDEESGEFVSADEEDSFEDFVDDVSFDDSYEE